MNFLAHAYLSFDDPDVLIGNFVADFVRGKQILAFSDAVQTGIRLHRQIDEFTDNHPLTREVKHCFDLTAGRYNATFLDIAFDHFLALDPGSEPNGGWKYFTQNCYQLLKTRMDELPPDFGRFFSYMYQEDWLYNYRYGWMIEKSFQRMARRAKFLDNEANVFSDFETNYRTLSDGYNEFFPELLAFSQTTFAAKKPINPCQS